MLDLLFMGEEFELNGKKFERKISYKGRFVGYTALDSKKDYCEMLKNILDNYTKENFVASYYNLAGGTLNVLKNADIVEIVGIDEYWVEIEKDKAVKTKRNIYKLKVEPEDLQQIIEDIKFLKIQKLAFQYNNAIETAKRCEIEFKKLLD